MRIYHKLTIVAATALLSGTAALSATAAHAQSKPSDCGIEKWSTDKMAYVTMPCTESQAQQSTKRTAGGSGCGIETWSTDKMSYVTVPCAPGTTEENPAGRN